jgi:hypothetical protein
VTQLKEIRGSIKFQEYVPSTGNAASTGGGVQFVAPHKLTIVAASLIPHAAITAHATDYAVLTLTRYTAGASATTVATRSWAATNSVDKTEESMTLSGTAANLILAAGDTLALLKTAAGSGLVIPALSLVITYQLAGV